MLLFGDGEMNIIGLVFGKIKPVYARNKNDVCQRGMKTFE